MTFLDELRDLEQSQSYRETKLKLELSEAVSKAMNELHLTAKELAELSAVSYQQILRILDDNHNSSLSTITKIAYAMNLEPSLYFHRPGERLDLEPAQDVALTFRFSDESGSEARLNYYKSDDSDNLRSVRFAE